MPISKWHHLSKPVVHLRVLYSNVKPYLGSLTPINHWIHHSSFWSWYTSLLVLLCTVLSILTLGYLYILHPEFGCLIATSSKGIHTIAVAMMLILFYYVLLVFLYSQLHVCDSKPFHLKLSTGSILFPQHLTLHWLVDSISVHCCYYHSHISHMQVDHFNHLHHSEYFTVFVLGPDWGSNPICKPHILWLWTFLVNVTLLDANQHMTINDIKLSLTLWHKIPMHTHFNVYNSQVSFWPLCYDLFFTPLYY